MSFCTEARRGPKTAVENFPFVLCIKQTIFASLIHHSLYIAVTVPKTYNKITQNLRTEYTQEYHPPRRKENYLWSWQPHPWVQNLHSEVKIKFFGTRCCKCQQLSTIHKRLKKFMDSESIPILWKVHFITNFK